MGARLLFILAGFSFLPLHVAREYDCKDLLFEQRVEATLDNQTLASPSYPHSGQSPLACRVTLEASNPKWRVAVQVVDMDIVGHNLSQSAILKLYDGKAFVGSVLAAPKANADLQGTYRSSGSQLSVAYEPNLEPRQARGFKLRFYSFDPSKLSVWNQEITVTTAGGTILSPSFPNSYPDEFSCWWLLRAPYGYNVHLEFEEFQLKDINSDHYWTNLCRDSMLIFEGESEELLGGDNSPSKKLCGKIEGSNPITSSDMAFFLKFQSRADNLPDHANFSKQFKIHYKAVPNPRICRPDQTVKLRVNKDTQILSSPNFPDTFDSNMVCRWHIDSPKRGERMNFEIRMLETTITGADCFKDRLTIHWSKIAGVMKETDICGGQRIAPMISHSPVDVVFSSNNASNPTHRFRLTYRGIVEKELGFRNGGASHFSSDSFLWSAAVLLVCGTLVF